MRQLLRQSDTVSKPNNVLSVPFQLNVGTKLFFFTPRGTTFGLLLCTDAFNTLSQCRVVACRNCRTQSFVCLPIPGATTLAQNRQEENCSPPEHFYL